MDEQYSKILSLESKRLDARRFLQVQSANINCASMSYI